MRQGQNDKAGVETLEGGGRVRAAIHPEAPVRLALSQKALYSDFKWSE